MVVLILGFAVYRVKRSVFSQCLWCVTAGYGWYVDRVGIKDVTRHVHHDIPCDRWLSSQEKDRQTFCSFPVYRSVSYTPGKGIIMGRIKIYWIKIN